MLWHCTGADPHSVRTSHQKSHVCSMQFSVCEKFPDIYKNSIMPVVASSLGLSVMITYLFRIDPVKADVFSLGVVFHRVILRRLPFINDDEAMSYEPVNLCATGISKSKLSGAVCSMYT